MASRARFCNSVSTGFGTPLSSRGSGGGELFATCDTPAGNFTFDHVQHSISDMVNNRTGDQTVFVDTDGKAYLICCNAMGRSHLYVCPLRPSDYLNVDAAVQVSEGPGREGNCLFKYHGRYYFCSSDLHGWNASPCHVIDAASIYGPYSDEYTMAGTEADFCHVTQTGQSSGSGILANMPRWNQRPARSTQKAGAAAPARTNSRYSPLVPLCLAIENASSSTAAD